MEWFDEDGIQEPQKSDPGAKYLGHGEFWSWEDLRYLELEIEVEKALEEDKE